MEKKDNSKKILIVIVILLFVIILGLVGYIIINDKNSSNKDNKDVATSENSVNESKKEDEIKTEDDEKITLEELYGTYTYEKNFTTSDGINLTYKVKLTISENGIAYLEASNGMSAESTKGKFTFDGTNIVYTREYYNYSGQQLEPITGTEIKTETFNVVDKNTLTSSISNFSNTETQTLKK